MKRSVITAVLLSLVCAYAEPTTPAEEKTNPEIEKIDKRLEELKTIWRQEQAIINGYTKNRTKAVREGSREYHACVKAAQRTKLAEEEAAKLKKKRTAILEGRSGGGSGSIEDAIAGMTKEEQLKFLEQDEALLKQMEAITTKMTRGELSPAVADRQLQQLSLQRINLRKKPEREQQAEEVKDLYKKEYDRIAKLRAEVTGEKTKEDGATPEKPAREKSKLSDKTSTPEGQISSRISIDKLNLSDTHQNFVGYWISEKKDESIVFPEGQEVDWILYDFVCFGPDGFWTYDRWTPYENFAEVGNIIKFDYLKVASPKYQRTLPKKIRVLGDGQIVVLNAGGEYSYRRITEEEWFERQKEQMPFEEKKVSIFEEDEINLIKGKMPLPAEP